MLSYGCHGDTNIITTDSGCYGNDSVSCLTVTIFIRCHSNNNNKAIDTVYNKQLVTYACAFVSMETTQVLILTTESSPTVTIDDNALYSRRCHNNKTTSRVCAENAHYTEIQYGLS